MLSILVEPPNMEWIVLLSTSTLDLRNLHVLDLLNLHVLDLLNLHVESNVTI